MEPTIFRHEYKHEISCADAVAVRARALAVMKHDEHTMPNGLYYIRSLYFDNFDDKVLQEKEDGLSRREKFRIRFYNGDTSFIRLEKKLRVNGLCAKQDAPVTKEQCEALLRGETDWMLQTGDPLLAELHAKMDTQQLRPKTIVDYHREPFVYVPGNVRVTIDFDICSGIRACDLFDFSAPTVSVGCERLLEVKYDAFLPDVIRHLVQMPNRSTGAYSKYAACRVF